MRNPRVLDAPITQGANIWAPMALSDGKLLVRNRRTPIVWT